MLSVKSSVNIYIKQRSNNKAWCVLSNGAEILRLFNIPLIKHSYDSYENSFIYIIETNDKDIFQVLNENGVGYKIIKQHGPNSYLGYSDVYELEVILPRQEENKSKMNDPIVTFTSFPYDSYDSADACGGSFTYRCWKWIISPEDLNVIKPYIKSDKNIYLTNDNEINSPKDFIEGMGGFEDILEYIQDNFSLVYKLVDYQYINQRERTYKLQICIEK